MQPSSNHKQFANTPGFYSDYQYGRAVKFLEFLRKLAHDNKELRNVGTIELVNEPTNWDSSVQSLRSTFYKNGYNVGHQSLYFVHLTNTLRPSAMSKRASASAPTTTSTSR